MLAEAAGPDQRAAKKMRPGHCTKKFHPESPGVTFLGTDTSFAQRYPPLLEKYLIEIKDGIFTPYKHCTEPGLPVVYFSYFEFQADPKMKGAIIGLFVVTLACLFFSVSSKLIMIHLYNKAIPARSLHKNLHVARRYKNDLV